MAASVTLKVVVATYNVPEWIKRCLVSIANQQDKRYEVCVVDDGSPPESGQPTFIEKFCTQQGWQYILNENRMGGPLPNQIAAIEKLGGNCEDVIVFIDGDDWLPGADVFSYLHGVYADPNVWVAYGTHRNEPESATTNIARAYPQEAWEHPSSVRGWTWENGIHFNHLRTFRYGLYWNMRPNQWRWPEGDWFTANGDTVLMIPALEMAGPKRTVLMEKVTYVYTPDHPQSEWCTRVRDVNPYFLRNLPPYEILEEM